ncbi:hypothetical protein D2E26_0980 [Bifidobacterium dolichotidis]|uniref:Uncharacterized protein n=1 Tax=Bifidobacterium dolichotidis TaxID=2306976 RepID=A0A430FQ28_9BIFI|nr:hypothetical protein [Bifidobacterium dolichotidis]RSX54926.1 hypothetical protein D2E26_0980 [Bifidobacterium dolichotidis]
MEEHQTQQSPVNKQSSSDAQSRKTQTQHNMQAQQPQANEHQPATSKNPASPRRSLMDIDASAIKVSPSVLEQERREMEARAHKLKRNRIFLVAGVIVAAICMILLVIM